MRTLYTSTSNGMKQGRQRISIVNSKEGKYMCTLWDLTHMCSLTLRKKARVNAITCIEKWHNASE
jgi:hypothetical protein